MPYSDWFLLGTLTHPLGIAESLFEGKESSCKIKFWRFESNPNLFLKVIMYPQIDLDARACS